jgi:hypothetical protein
MWLKTFLVELDFKQEEATIVFINNQKNISLVKNSIYHELKHIDIGHHYVRELVQVIEIMLKYCNTNEMSIDLWTKGILY